MSWQESLEDYVSRTGVERYRWLCSEDNPNAMDREAYRRFVVEQATGTESSVQSERTVISTGNGGMVTIPLEESLRLNKEMRECPHYEKRGCNTCGKAFCKIGKGEPGERMNSQYGLVSTWDCYHCLRPDVELYAINAYKKI